MKPGRKTGKQQGNGSANRTENLETGNTARRSISLYPEDEHRIRMIMQKERVTRTEAIRRALAGYEGLIEWDRIDANIQESISKALDKHSAKQSKDPPKEPPKDPPSGGDVPITSREMRLIRAGYVVSKSYVSVMSSFMGVSAPIPGDVDIEDYITGSLGAEWDTFHDNSVRAIQQFTEDKSRLNAIFTYMCLPYAIPDVPWAFFVAEEGGPARIVLSASRTAKTIIDDLVLAGFDVDTPYQKFLREISGQIRKHLPKSYKPESTPKNTDTPR